MCVCVRSTFNWTVPFVSWLVVVALGVACILLYYIPLRYMLLAWGEWLLRCHSNLHLQPRDFIFYLCIAIRNQA